MLGVFLLGVTSMVGCGAAPQPQEEIKPEPVSVELTEEHIDGIVDYAARLVGTATAVEIIEDTNYDVSPLVKEFELVQADFYFLTVEQQEILNNLFVTSDEMVLDGVVTDVGDLGKDISMVSLELAAKGEEWDSYYREEILSQADNLTTELINICTGGN